MAWWWKKKKPVNGERAAKLKKQKEEAELMLSRANGKMFSKKCPINDNKNCNDSCMHLMRGRVRLSGFATDNWTHWTYDAPKCKLWK